MIAVTLVVGHGPRATAMAHLHRMHERAETYRLMSLPPVISVQRGMLPDCYTSVSIAQDFGPVPSTAVVTKLRVGFFTETLQPRIATISSVEPR